MEKQLNKNHESSLCTSGSCSHPAGICPESVTDCFGGWCIETSAPDSDGIYQCSIYESDHLLSTFSILPYTKTPTAYFFDWKVLRPGQGTGTRLFPMILSHLSKNYDRIKLQVSSDNTAAMKIYSSNNLVITETASSQVQASQEPSHTR